MTINRHYPTIKYTSRDFNSIKNDLVEYAKRYYPNTFQDFNEAGFGSLMLDTVSYVGDILSFYVDYNVNESFLDTAVEYDNVLKLGRQLGYKFKGNASSFGIANFYVVIPANSSGLGPDSTYIPSLKRGTKITSDNNTPFMLNENISFSDSSNEVIVAKVDSTSGTPTHYAIKASGQVISGEFYEETFEIGNFEPFRKVQLADSNITEIVSVVDTEGNRYTRVENLAENIVFAAVKNYGSNNSKVPSLLKPVAIPRRFSVEHLDGEIFLQFGGGDEKDTKTDPLTEPSTTLVNFYGRNYVTDTSFDPTNLIKTPSLGIAPANTTLSVVYRTNKNPNINVATAGLAVVLEPLIAFQNEIDLDIAKMQDVITSLEVSNDEPINGSVANPTIDELKLRIYDSFSAQRRAVTEKDYKSLIYAMPQEFGAITRTAIIRDPSSFKRNLNIYVISEDNEGFLETTNSATKNNLKLWLNDSRMVNDTLDIIDAKIINVGIDFVIVGEVNLNKYSILTRCINALKQLYRVHLDIGESLSISTIYTILNSVPGVVDTVSVKIIKKEGLLYSNTTFNLEEAIVADGRAVAVPENVILEIKFPDEDIRGSVR